MKPKVGDLVWFGAASFRGKREFSTKAVTGVGRKYFYVGRSKFEINNKGKALSVVDGNYHDVAYESKDVYDEEQRRYAAITGLVGMLGSRWRATEQLRDVPTDNILRATELLKGGAL